MANNNPTNADTKPPLFLTTSGLRGEIEWILGSHEAGAIANPSQTVRESAAKLRDELILLNARLRRGVNSRSQILDLEADGQLAYAFTLGGDLGFRAREIRTALLVGAFAPEVSR